MCRDETVLKSIWFDLYENDLLRKSSDVDDRIVGPFMLIERTVVAFKELGENYINTLDEVKTIKTELDKASKEVQVLKEKLNETQKPCESCEVLVKDLSLAKKRAKEAEFRVQQIAKILVVRSADDVEEKTAETHIESPKRKKACLRDKDDNADIGISSQDVEVGFSISPEKNVEKMTPEKMTKASPPTKSRSPKNVFGRKNRLSRSADLDGSPLKRVSPRRNLSADFNIDITDSSSKRLKKVNKQMRNPDYGIKELCTNDSFSEYAKKCGPELDQMWFGDDDVVLNGDKNKENGFFALQETVVDIVVGNKSGKNRERNVEISPKTLRQKKSRCDKMIKNPDNSYNLLFEKKVPKKRFKQLTLQIQPSNSKLTSEAESDGDDIVLPSPKKPEEVEAGMPLLDEDFDCSFAPRATSTQKPDETCQVSDKKISTPPRPKINKPSTSNRQLDNSFDVVLDRRRTTPSPNYKYKGKTVRGKARAQLQGWDCDDCKKFYELACKNQSPSKVKAKMNVCSRHRSKYKQARPPTPPGFWDLDIPDTPE